MGFGKCALESLAVKQEFWRGRRVLITGHTGFKGAWLALWLESLGAELHGLALAPATTPNLFDLAAPRMTSTLGDLRDPAVAQAVVAEAAEFAQNSPEPEPSELFTDILVDA